MAQDGDTLELLNDLVGRALKAGADAADAVAAVAVAAAASAGAESLASVRSQICGIVTGLLQ